MQRLEWESAPVNAGNADRISILWTGAMGYITQPPGSFTMYLNEHPLLDLGVSLSSRVCGSADGRTELLFDVPHASGQDAFGVFYLTVPASMLEEGHPARLSVTGSDSKSLRWFRVFDYTDTIEHED